MNYIYRVLDYMAWFWFMEWLILVCIINRIIHGRLEIWNLSSRVHIRYLTGSLRSLVRYRCEHSKINSISPRDHVLFSMYFTIVLVLFSIALGCRYDNRQNQFKKIVLMVLGVCSTCDMYFSISLFILFSCQK